MSRDPIGELGGMNLYGFLGNDGVGRVDLLGFRDGCPEGQCCVDEECVECEYESEDEIAWFFGFSFGGPLLFDKNKPPPGMKMIGSGWRPPIRPAGEQKQELVKHHEWMGQRCCSGRVQPRAILDFIDTTTGLVGQGLDVAEAIEGSSALGLIPAIGNAVNEFGVPAVALYLRQKGIECHGLIGQERGKELGLRRKDCDLLEYLAAHIAIYWNRGKQ